MSLIFLGAGPSCAGCSALTTGLAGFFFLDEVAAVLLTPAVDPFAPSFDVYG